MHRINILPPAFFTISLFACKNKAGFLISAFVTNENTQSAITLQQNANTPTASIRVKGSADGSPESEQELRKFISDFENLAGQNRDQNTLTKQRDLALATPPKIGGGDALRTTGANETREDTKRTRPGNPVPLAADMPIPDLTKKAIRLKPIPKFNLINESGGLSVLVIDALKLGDEQVVAVQRCVNDFMEESRKMVCARVQNDALRNDPQNGITHSRCCQKWTRFVLYTQSSTLTSRRRSEPRPQGRPRRCFQLIPYMENWEKTA